MAIGKGWSCTCKTTTYDYTYDVCTEVSGIFKDPQVGAGHDEQFVLYDFLCLVPTIVKNLLKILVRIFVDHNYLLTLK